MLVKMRTVYASERASAQPGVVIDLPDDEALALVAGGYAAHLKTPDARLAVAEVVESAVITVPEKAVAPAQERPRGRNR